MNNTALWETLAVTDPAHTKKFKRAGGFEGTAVKPIYTELKMTETFGACGVGWGITEPSFITVPAGDEMLVYCTVGIWYVYNSKRSETVYGVGGDLAIKKFNSGKVAADDEAFKKAFTDAIGNAMKHIGMSADVHMGQHDDSKYVTQVRKEIADKAKGVDDRTPQQILDQFTDRVSAIAIGDRESFEQAWNEEKSDLSRVQRNSPEAYNKFITELHQITHQRRLDHEGGSEDAPKTTGKQEPEAGGGDSPARIKAREMLKAWKASAHLTALETSMKQAGFLTIGEDGWVVKPDSHLGVIREQEPEVFHMFAAEIDKLRIALTKGKAA